MRKSPARRWDEALRAIDAGLVSTRSRAFLHDDLVYMHSSGVADTSERPVPAPLPRRRAPRAARHHLLTRADHDAGEIRSSDGARVETQAARLVPMPIAKGDVDDLKRVQTVHDAAVANGDLGLVFRSNVEFHNLLFSKTGNRYLIGAIKQFAMMTHGIRFYCLTYPGYLEQARREHWLMIEAIEILR